MPDEDKSLDLGGLGKAASAIPPEAWKEMAATASGMVRDLVSPLTTTTTGTARLIQGYFDRLADVQKINAAEIVRKAREKIEQSGKPSAMQVQPRVVTATLEGASLETEPALAELWSNLLANEFTVGDIHPEIPHILARLTAADANLLVKIVGSQNTVAMTFMRNAILRRKQEDQPVEHSGSISRFLTTLAKQSEGLSHSVLAATGLAERSDGGWTLTLLGKAFVKAVTDPSMPSGESAPSKAAVE